MKTTLSLTEQQVIVLKLIAQGYLTKQIARQLQRSERTIDTHRRMICAALGVPNMHAAIILAIQVNIIKLQEIEVLRTEPEKLGKSTD